MNQENSENIINFHSDFNRFVDETCRVLEGLQLPCSPLQYVLRQELVNQDGLWLEFGVGSGHTLNLICEYRKKGTVYGFDSFEGLPTDWRPGFLKGALLSKIENTGATFLTVETARSISLLHIDCDLYSSTKTVFSYLGSRLTTGSIIVFDELIGYPSFEKHELKAFYEFGRLGTHKFQCWFPQSVPLKERVAVRVLKQTNWSPPMLAVSTT